MSDSEMTGHQSMRTHLPSTSQAYSVGEAIGLTIVAIAAALVSAAVIGIRNADSEDERHEAVLRLAEINREIHAETYAKLARE